jgi:hypothetical protein
LSRRAIATMSVVLDERAEEAAAERQQAEPDEDEQESDGTGAGHRTVGERDDEERDATHGNEGGDGLDRAGENWNRPIAELAGDGATGAKQSIARVQGLGDDDENETHPEGDDEKETSELLIRDEPEESTEREQEGRDDRDELARLERA